MAGWHKAPALPGCFVCSVQGLSLVPSTCFIACPGYKEVPDTEELSLKESDPELRSACEESAPLPAVIHLLTGTSLPPSLFACMLWLAESPGSVLPLSHVRVPQIRDVVLSCLKGGFSGRLLVIFTTV